MSTAKNPAPIEKPKDGETFPVVGVFEIIDEQDVQPLGDVFPPEIEPNESEALDAEDRAMLREWILPFIGRAPSCKTEIGREIVRGMRHTAQDELNAIESFGAMSGV